MTLTILGEVYAAFSYIIFSNPKSIYCNLNIFLYTLFSNTFTLHSLLRMSNS